MKIIKLNEGDLIRIIKKMIHEQPQEPLDQPEETTDQRKERKQHIYTTKQHIVQMGISIMNDIEEIRSFRNEIESANYHPEDKEELVGLCNYTISLIHNDTFPPTKTSPHDEDDYDY